MLDLCTKYYDTFIFNMYGNSIMTCTFIIKQSVWPCVCFIEVQVHAKPRQGFYFIETIYQILTGAGLFSCTGAGWYWSSVYLIVVQVHAKLRLACPFCWDPLPDTYRGWVIFNYCGRVNINFLGLGDIDKCMPHWGTSSCQSQDKVSILLRQFTWY